MIDLVLLGCGGNMPMPNRFLSSLFINYKGRKILIDCGEGTQVSMRMKNCGFKNIDLICITHLHGSFAETYKGHGTDKALVGGILGFDPDDARIKYSFELAKEQGVKFEFIKTNLGENVHPNTVKMEMILEDGSKSTVMGASIGGGNIKLTEMDGLALDFNGSRSAVVLEIKDIPGAIAFITGILGHNNKNISMISTNKPAKSEYTFLTIETEDELESSLIDQLRKFEVVAKVVVLDKF